MCVFIPPVMVPVSVDIFDVCLFMFQPGSHRKWVIFFLETCTLDYFCSTPFGWRGGIRIRSNCGVLCFCRYRESCQRQAKLLLWQKTKSVFFCHGSSRAPCFLSPGKHQPTGLCDFTTWKWHVFVFRDRLSVVVRRQLYPAFFRSCAPLW